MTNPTIGVAIAAFNASERIGLCLQSVYDSTMSSELYVVVVDDGSTDGTGQLVREQFPRVRVIMGSGSLWWAGATNVAIRECISAGCEAVVLLNPDVLVAAQAIEELWVTSNSLGNAIVSPVVVDASEPTCIWEAGHAWEPVIKHFPVFWRIRYLFAHGSSVSGIPNSPYPTASLVGRGGLVPTKMFERIGFLDARRFPQYGGDTVLGIKAFQAGWPMYVVPSAEVTLDIRQTGMNIPTGILPAFMFYFRYLFVRRHGERARVLWLMSVCLVSWYAVIPNYLFWLCLNTYRYWERVLASAR